MRTGTRVLGIDTSLRSTGYAVVDSLGTRLTSVDYGRIQNPSSRSLSACLRALHGGIGNIIDRHHPSAVAVEGVFFSRNANTALILGEARGTAIAVCATRDLPIFEYAPRRVKQAVVGYGAADKSQVRKMVMTLLALTDEPQEDASDALAIAICHIQSLSTHEAMAPEPI